MNEGRNVEMSPMSSEAARQPGAWRSWRAAASTPMIGSAQIAHVALAWALTAAPPARTGERAVASEIQQQSLDPAIHAYFLSSLGEFIGTGLPASCPGSKVNAQSRFAATSSAHLCSLPKATSPVTHVTSRAHPGPSLLLPRLVTAAPCSPFPFPHLLSPASPDRCCFTAA